MLDIGHLPRLNQQIFQMTTPSCRAVYVQSPQLLSF